MPPDTEHILRIDRSDSEGAHVLVNVSSNGPSPLDLKLLATEATLLRILKRDEVKQSRIAKLRDKRSKPSDEEWEAALLRVLLYRRYDSSALKKDSVNKLEVVAHVTGEYLAIKFRNNISGIMQGLGEILLKQDETQEFDVTHWAAKAVERSMRLEADVEQLTVKYEEQSKTVVKLNQQLEDFIEAKKKHEDLLLEKFRELLNEKKLKIRDQQRLLAGAKIDNKLAEKVQANAEISKARTPIDSRKGKRKTSAVLDESSEDSGFEAKPIPKVDDEMSEQQHTPGTSGDDTTEDESEDNRDTNPSDPALPAREGPVAAGEMDLDKAPPQRELPFGDTKVIERDSVSQEKSRPSPKMSSRSMVRHDETDNDDDEDDEL